jgi:hypothetical protein
MIHDARAKIIGELLSADTEREKKALRAAWERGFWTGTLPGAVIGALAIALALWASGALKL